MIQAAAIYSYLSNAVAQLDETKDHFTLRFYIHIINLALRNALRVAIADILGIEAVYGRCSKSFSTRYICQVFLEICVMPKLATYLHQFEDEPMTT